MASVVVASVLTGRDGESLSFLFLIASLRTRLTSRISSDFLATYSPCSDNVIKSKSGSVVFVFLWKILRLTRGTRLSASNLLVAMLAA